MPETLQTALEISKGHKQNLIKPKFINPYALGL
jgi:hypothetical protein